MSVVIIGVDPHKASHTAFAVDRDEVQLGQVRVKANHDQVAQLQRWARRWPDRVWAVEGARGLGHLLSQQLLDAGENVLDVQPKLAARVRLLNTGRVNKNDPNDARSVAIAALRSKAPRLVELEDHVAVMKLWSRRHRDLSRERNRIVCRLHAVLVELVPGGFPSVISANLATSALQNITATEPVAAARLALARELLNDLLQVDQKRREARKHITTIVQSSTTTLTDIPGVGPVIAATVLGFVGDVHRFPTRDAFASYTGTAPIEASSGNRTVHRLSLRGNRQMNHAVHMAAVSQISHDTPGRVFYQRKLAEGMPPKSALRALKRRISDALYARMIADAKRDQRQRESDPGGQSGNDSESSATDSHPSASALRRSHSRADTHTTTEDQQPSRPRPSTSRRTY